MSKVAAIQMASGPNSGANLLEAERLIARAAKEGATFVALPENFALLGSRDSDRVAVAEDDGDGRLQRFLSDQARRHGIWLVGGTIPIRSDVPDHVYGACLVYDDAGERRARFDKMHLFDVHFEERGERYDESASTEPGRDVVVIDSPIGRLGLAVCYDLRFPELFRRMLDMGMEVCVLPSAFTVTTGRAHWEVLCRARAIENLCYVIAPAQGGYHASGRETYGDSMIVDPWGTIQNRRASGAGVVMADVDPGRVARTREVFPALTHRRLGE